MRWIVIVLFAGFGVGCGGKQIPVHSGYKSDKAKPWKKPKVLTLDDKSEAKSEGDLSYADYRRAKWFQVTLPSHGELTVKVEITPPGEAANDDFDLGLDILDPGFRVIGQSNLETEDPGELTKVKTLYDLEPGKYLIHLYLQNRMDTADFLVRVTFRPTKSPESHSDFPSRVAELPPLATIPITDDAPKGKTPPPVTIGPRTPRPPRPPPPPVGQPKPPATVLSARIVGVSVVAGGTRITIGRGTSTGAQSGMKARLSGLGEYAIQCNETSCYAVITGKSPDQLSSLSSVTLIP